jgi:hypothetical protein
MQTGYPDYVAALARRKRADLVMLAECGIDPVTVARALNTEVPPGRLPYAHCPALGPCAVALYAALPQDAVGCCDQGRRYAMWGLRHDSGAETLLVGAHLASKMWRTADDQRSAIAEMAVHIRAIEEKRGHQRTVVLGDLNVNPFEPGMVAADSLHSVMTRGDAARAPKTVEGRTYPCFYNPMWNHFGDDAGPAGTYYRRTGSFVEHYWNMFDQVLVRPSLVASLKPGTVEIVTMVGEMSLLTRNGLPDKNISDHLPVFFALAV